MTKRSPQTHKMAFTMKELTIVMCNDTNGHGLIGDHTHIHTKNVGAGGEEERE
jgi:hypothetical protein